jgi:hypothetical protein
VAVLFHVRGLGTLFDTTTDAGLRSAQGHELGRWAIAAAAIALLLQLVVALVQKRVRLAPRLRIATGTVVLVVAIAGLGIGANRYVDRYDGWGGFARTVADQFRGAKDSGPGSDTPSRLLSVSSNGRVAIWREGIDQYRLHPVAGTGAGTFRFSNWLFRDQPRFVVKHAHSQWVNALSELGIVGTTLLTLGLGALLVSTLRPVGRGRRDQDRGVIAGLQAGAVVFTLHMALDWDWDLAAATIAFMLFAGVVAAYVRGSATAIRDDAGVVAAASSPDHPRSGTAFGVAPRVFVTGLLVLLAVSWTLPYLSERAYDQALKYAADGRLDEAAAAARRAHRYDPLGVESLLMLSLIQQQQGDGAAARATLDEARRLQPQNYDVWVKTGQLELNVYGRKKAAEAAFRRALALNPLDAEILYQLQLAGGD